MPQSPEEQQFWQARWENRHTGWDQTEPNALLVRYFDTLGVVPGGRVFVPLCGRSVDMHWLRRKGYAVVGSELSQLAIEDLFKGLGVEPEITQLSDKVIRYSHGPAFEVFVGDIFALDASTLGHIDAVYDRAALIALPEQVRVAYVPQVTAITGGAPQLLITVNYNQELRSGPPYSVSKDEIDKHFGPNAATELGHDESAGAGSGGLLNIAYQIAPRSVA